MSRTATLGLFILAALVLFGAAVFRIGSKRLTFGTGYTLKAGFNNVSGLTEGAEVQVGGLPKGTISSIELPRKPGEKITVVMNLQSDTRGLIRRDSVASIQTEGLLGNKFVAVSFGSPQGAPVRDGDTIAGNPPLDMADIMQKTSKVLDSTHSALQNVDAATVDLKEMTAKINNGQGTLGALLNDKAMYNELNAAASNVRQTAEKLNTGQGTVGALLNDRTMYDQLSAAAANVRQTAEKINSGQGTLGALVNDPSMYNELNSAAADIRQTAEAAKGTVEQAKKGVTSFQENMEALKHNFFLRGFFKKRGYTDPAQLTQNEIPHFPNQRASRAFVIDADQIFKDSDTAKLSHEDRLNQIGEYLRTHPYSLAVVTSSSGMVGDSDKQRTLTQARAVVVRDYLVNKFPLDDTRIKTKGLGKQPGAGEGDVQVLIYSLNKAGIAPDPEQRAAE